MTDDEHEGIRGDELADQAADDGAAPVPPVGEGLRGDELADDAGATDDAPTARLVRDAPRGDDLAEDA
jgi:hypothetical protein